MSAKYCIEVMTNMPATSTEDLLSAAVLCDLGADDLECGEYQVLRPAQHDGGPAASAASVTPIVVRKKKKIQSNIWKHFSRLDEDPTKARCNICMRNFDYDAKGCSTSNMIKHLRKIHKQDPVCMKRKSSTDESIMIQQGSSPTKLQPQQQPRYNVCSSENGTPIRRKWEGQRRRLDDLTEDSMLRRRLADRLDAICKAIDVRAKCGDKTTKDHLPKDIVDLLYPTINL